MQQAAIYARVSSEKQEREQTIASQLAALRETCKREGVRVTKEYADDGISGATLARPALDRLRDDAARGLFEVVYILSPDRLARKYLYQALILDELKKRRVRVTFMNSPATDRPEDQLLLGIQGVIAEYERAQITERIRRGKLYRARMGALQTSSPTYGYRLVRRTETAPARYEIEDEQATVVRLIFQLYIQTRSCLKVARELHRRGIHSARGLEHWNPGNIVRLLRCECYIGVAHYNKTGKSGILRDRSEWVPIKVPALVDHEIFQLAQRILDQHGGGTTRRFYLLSRLVTCALCHHMYVGDSSGQTGYRRRHYRCAFARRNYPRPKGCSAKAIHAERLEEAVVSAMRHAILRPETLLRHVVGVAEQARRSRALGPSRAQTGRKRQALDERRRLLLDLYLDQKISKEEFTTRRKELERALDDLERSLADSPAADPEKMQERIRSQVTRFCTQAQDRFDSLAPDELQHFLRLLVDEIEYDWKRQRATIRGHIPNSLGTLDVAGGFPREEMPANWAATVRFAIPTRVESTTGQAATVTASSN